MPDADKGPPLQGVSRVEGTTEDPVAEVRKETRRWRSRFTIRDLLADKRCSQAVPDFLSTTDVGRLAPAEEDTGSEVSKWERRERREREEERRAEAEELGAGEGRAPLFLPTPSFMASACDQE